MPWAGVCRSLDLWNSIRREGGDLGKGAVTNLQRKSLANSSVKFGAGPITARGPNVLSSRPLPFFQDLFPAQAPDSPPQAWWQVQLGPAVSGEMAHPCLRTRHGMGPSTVGWSMEEVTSDPSSGPFWGSPVTCHRSCPLLPYHDLHHKTHSSLSQCQPGKSGID